MADYKGNLCPVCKEKFKAGDDIVVCPDCGTPYHRACWQKAGVCLHQAEHTAGFEWTPDNVITGSPDDLVCPNCGTHNPLGARFCNHCGVSLPEHPDNIQYKEAHRPPETGGPVYANGSPTERRVYGAIYTEQKDGSFRRREVGPDEPLSGIPAHDWAVFIGPSSLHYLARFFRMQETRRKVSVSFSAFFLGPIYFFYRKMWKLGALFAALDVLLNVPSLLYIMAVSGAEWMSGMPLRWIPVAMEVCYLLNWVQMIVRGLFAVYWYRKDGAHRIHSVWEKFPEGQMRSDHLALTGGTSWVAVAVYLGLYLAAGMLGSRLMGPDLSAVIRLLSV